MPKFSLLPNEKLILQDTAILLRQNLGGHMGTVYLTSGRLVMEASGSPTAGILLKLLLPFLGDRVVLDLPLKDIQKVSRAPYGKAEIAMIETREGLTWKLRCDKLDELIGHLQPEKNEVK